MDESEYAPKFAPFIGMVSRQCEMTRLALKGVPG